MAIATGSCPSCGAPIEFGLGASIAKVCEFCNATVVRSDRGLENLGKVAAIAEVPSLIAVGDTCAIDGRQMEVVGRVQLDHGAGPWDEYYVAFDYGQSWGWLAYAEGHYILTTKAPGLAAPPFQSLQLEQDVQLGSTVYRVTEVKTARVASAQGEQPSADRPGATRYYADLLGPDGAYATIDYGDNTGQYEVFTGWVVAETRIQVTQGGPRSVSKIKTNMIRCPNCGGDVPKLNGERSKRLGCPYCGAVSDIALQQVVAQQEAAAQAPEIPIGAQGTLGEQPYLCIAYIRRSALFDGERFSWDEYLVFGVGVGYRWLVKDEASWMWAEPVNLADLDLAQQPARVRWGGRTFNRRNSQQARVDYVLGEVFWQVEVGETTRAADFADGKDILSREEGPGEVRWSFSHPVPWPVLAAAFQLPPDGPGGHFVGGGGGGAESGGVSRNGMVTLVVILILLAIVCAVGGTCSDTSGTGSSGVGATGAIFGGSSGYIGGK
ncbi:MAG: hypothetical protein RJA70_4455 [Pseudomonadota bacterium]|jgi:hypothetical protein